MREGEHRGHTEHGREEGGGLASDHSFVCSRRGRWVLRGEGQRGREGEIGRTDREEWTQWIERNGDKAGGREGNNNINFQSLDWVTAAPLSTVLMTLRVVLSPSRRWRLHRRGSCQIRLFLSVRLHVTAAKIRQQRSIYKSRKIKKHFTTETINLI